MWKKCPQSYASVLTRIIHEQQLTTDTDDERRSRRREQTLVQYMNLKNDTECLFYLIK